MFIDWKGANWEDRRPYVVVPQIHLVCLTKLRVIKRLGEQVYRSTGGTNFNWRTLELGHLWIFVDSGYLASKRVPVFKFRLCCDPFILWEWGDFVSRWSWRSDFCLCMLWLYDLQFWSVVAEKQLGISLSRIGSFWAGCMVTVSA